MHTELRAGTSAEPAPSPTSSSTVARVPLEQGSRRMSTTGLLAHQHPQPQPLSLRGPRYAGTISLS